MDNAQKAIMIGVGLFITIIIISAVLLITNLGTDLINDAAGEVGNLTESLKNDMARTYDGKTLTGSEMIACVKKYAGNSSMCMQVKSGRTTYYFTAVKATLPTNLIAADYKLGGIEATATGKASPVKTAEEASTLISATDSYKTALVYSPSGALIGIAAIKI